MIFSRYLLSALTFLCAAIAVGAFGWITLDVFVHGVGGLDWSFLLEEPSMAGRRGGIAPIIVSTLLILFIFIVTIIPVGLATTIAIFVRKLHKPNDAISRLIQYSLDILAGIPSIVFGLFGYAFFAQVLGFGFSILSGGLTLTCMALPLFIRLSEEALQRVPQSIVKGAAATGFHDFTATAKIVIPCAFPGILAAFILSVARALAETAALIFTSGYVDRYPESLLDSGRALSVHILDMAMNVPGGNTNAYRSAFVLLLILLITNIAAKVVITGRKTGPSGEVRL